MHAAGISDVAATIGSSVAVEQFTIPTGFGHTDAIAMTGDGSEVAKAHDGMSFGARLPEISDDGVVGVVEIDPLKPAPIKVYLV